MLTLDDVRHRVVGVFEEAKRMDDEAAHSREDSLWNDVLAAIAAGAPNPAELAEEALKTNEIEFSRWYA